MTIALIIHTVLAIVLFAGSFAFQMATVMGAASPGASKRKEAPGLALMGFLLPAVWPISLLGAWLAYWLDSTTVAWLFVAMPYLYGLALLISILLFFRGMQKDA